MRSWLAVPVEVAEQAAQLVEVEEPVLALAVLLELVTA